MTEKKKQSNAWSWIPSLYFAEGLPLIVISAVSVVMYKRMGVSNADIAFFTSWLYLPWVLKGLWSPIVDNLRTKRFWILLTQFLMGAGFASFALFIPMPEFFRISLMLFWLLAFNSATHDIAADGFYIIGLDEHKQVWFCGIRNTFYRFGVIAGQGLLVMLAGYVEQSTGLPELTVNVNAVKKVEGDTSTNLKLLRSTLPELRPAEGDLRMLAFKLSDLSQLSAEKTSFSTEIPFGSDGNSEYFSKTKKLVKQWNEQFLEKDESADLKQTENKKTQNGKDKKQKKEKYGVLEKLLRNIFDVKEKKKKSPGNFELICVRLSRPPPENEKVNVLFGSKGGNKNIAIEEGFHRTFTSENWNKPLLSMIKVDPNLKKPVSAKFAATAGNIKLSWIVAFLFLGAMYFAVAVYHFFILPRPADDRPGIANTREKSKFKTDAFFDVFISFFSKKGILAALAFLLLYRLGEAQLVKLTSPFLLDLRENGGLALTTADVGFAYGTVGIAALTIGGIVGSFLAAKFGLKKMIWWMVIAINIPDAVYIYLAGIQPESFALVNLCVAIEQFGYGIGFTGYMLFMVYFAEDSKYKTAHYAIMTGFMAMGMMFPGMISGWIQEIIGYNKFFTWVLISTIPGFIAVYFIKINPEFGKKGKDKSS